jgi:NADPH:quinone reductase-like Zn-dependent oxidoreductase
VKLSISDPGLLQTLKWVTDDLHTEPLPETFIEVEIKSIGLNFRDVMIAMGEYAACDFGGEAAGFVSQVGSKVSRFKPGDRVVYLGGLGSGCFQTYGRVDDAFAVHLPGDLDFSIAAGIPCVWITVLYALQEIARLSEGETILEPGSTPQFTRPKSVRLLILNMEFPRLTYFPAETLHSLMA